MKNSIEYPIPINRFVRITFKHLIQLIVHAVKTFIELTTQPKAAFCICPLAVIMFMCGRRLNAVYNFECSIQEIIVKTFIIAIGLIKIAPRAKTKTKTAQTVNEQKHRRELKTELQKHHSE